MQCYWYLGFNHDYNFYQIPVHAKIPLYRDLTRISPRILDSKLSKKVSSVMGKYFESSYPKSFSTFIFSTKLQNGNNK